MIPRFQRPLSFATVAISVLLFSAVPVMAQSSGLNAAEKSDLERVSAALNAVRTMEGSFVQVGPEGQVDQGKFYIEKPGKMRFEYAPPNPTLIVSDGRWVAVENTRLNTIDRYALWTTPLNLILGDDIDLRDDTDVIGVEHKADELLVSARQHKGHVNGDLVLVFSEPALALKQWTVKDAQGLLTTVAVNNIKTGIALDPGLFSTLAQQNSTGKTN